MLKHLPADNLKSIQKTILYSKKPVYFANTNYKRRNFNSKDIVTTGLNTAQITEKKKNHAKDLNIDERISLFHDQIADKYIYRIPLTYLSECGKINFPTKIDNRIKLLDYIFRKGHEKIVRIKKSFSGTFSRRRNHFH